MAKCEVCFRHCEIKDGDLGFCMGRTCKNGQVIPSNYGHVTSIALDPIEKKPLYHFYPGSYILSVGSYGCNLRCPFCQNDSISWGEEVNAMSELATESSHHSQHSQYFEYISPEELVQIALKYRPQGNIGIAFTYNEPLIEYEYIKDVASIAHKAGLKNVLVSNGTAELSVLEKIIPYIDAMNIDLKCFTEEGYKSLGGNLDMTKDFISEAARHCHIEITTLVVPGLNDNEEEIASLSAWIASLKGANDAAIGPEIPYHLSRFFPRFHLTDREPTDIKLLHKLKKVAEVNLHHVYLGNC